MIELEPLAEHDADERRLREDELADAGGRLRNGLSLNRFALALDEATASG